MEAFDMPAINNQWVKQELLDKKKTKLSLSISVWFYIFYFMLIFCRNLSEI